MANTRSEEQQLWARALNQDGRAFGELYDLHAPRVFRHAARLCGNNADADEVVATAFFELWRRQSSVRLVDGSILPWLLVVTTNVARNQKRAARRYRAMLDELAAGGLERAQGEPIHETNERVLDALARLNPVEAGLIVLTVVEGFSVREAALAVGLSEGSARVRLHRTRRKLRGDLAAVRADQHSDIDAMEVPR
ncbi:RNA polymerase sigma factor [Galbitalea soli]|uniref:RNA polymerase sigma factor n=1 Tax=Galbitalea soli TaxID=1268042 RepID=A0A7C9PM96_9MICO|nr:RNA polymerase sigma factor [Galbitalea soli]NEM90745.1 RNA polymerase sigma factor [Galbitalea soli]NYJ31463.1 RNA polymerase sigma-70 factor (ECF subfamily) [Galbitalea soli]